MGGTKIQGVVRTLFAVAKWYFLAYPHIFRNIFGPDPKSELSGVKKTNFIWPDVEVSRQK
jgi:hypothetical protein